MYERGQALHEHEKPILVMLFSCCTEQSSLQVVSFTYNYSQCIYLCKYEICQLLAPNNLATEVLKASFILLRLEGVKGHEFFHNFLWERIIVTTLKAFSICNCVKLYTLYL